MTVEQLLAKLADAFPAFNAKALAAWAPVFRARLARHEGPTLQQAYTDTLAAFTVAKDKSLFPVPANFEANLPSMRINLPSEGHSIRGALKDRAERQKRVFSTWLQTQGAKIKQARPVAVYNACVMLAADLAKATDRVILKPEQITLCEERALSQARVAMFGALPRTNEAWQAQIEQVRVAWANPQRVAA
ncbi:hypothetical protein [uncultured Bradyrhizobium sp.]|uniref:hypothetical protein n=1 Tax=uncultured Bradyrhizobium sp. TaxID=199684 RepID=UPI002629914E|nr:hypothetical protein [uncultured Bradyrhizobium sp.]